jgi:Xaa-Pro aminopeptidase
MKHCAAEGRIDALLVSRPVDVMYLSGFTGEDSVLLVGDSWASLITDGRFAEQASDECGGLDAHVRTGPLDAAVAGQVRRYKVRRLAIQDDYTTVQAQRSLAEKLPSRRIRGLCGVVSALRATKDAEEVRRITKAVRVAERAFRELIAGGARSLAGKTERGGGDARFPAALPPRPGGDSSRPGRSD